MMGAVETGGGGGGAGLYVRFQMMIHLKRKASDTETPSDEENRPNLKKVVVVGCGRE